MNPGPNVLLRRPRVICHMAVSIDGRVVVDGWPESVAAAVRRAYELVHERYEADGWIRGRVTMEPFAGGVRAEVDVAREHTGRAPRENFRASGDLGSFAIAIDPSGRLAWESNDIGGWPAGRSSTVFGFIDRPRNRSGCAAVLFVAAICRGSRTMSEGASRPYEA